MHNKGQCKTCRDRLVLYLYGELGVIETTMVREHLDICEKCKSEYDELVLGLQAVVFVLKEGDGFEIEEVASLLGISVGAVRSHLVRAVETLKKVIKKETEQTAANGGQLREDSG
jgi:Sigma-70, region 4/Putative zinc-finger